MKKEAETINERIAKIRAHYCKGNNIEFASAMGEKTNTTSNWVSKAYAKIGLNVILKISNKFPKVDLNWLINGSGEMIKNDHPPQEFADNENIFVMNAKDRLKSFLVYLKIGQNSFEKKAGISNGYVNNFKGSIGSEIAARISDAYPELNLHWLLTGKGEMKIADSPPPDNTSTELTGLKNEVKQLIELLTEKENRLQDMKKSIQDKDKIITLLEQQQPAGGRAAADKREVLVRTGSR